MRKGGSNSWGQCHNRLHKVKPTGGLRVARIVPGHIATLPTQILGDLFRRTAQQAKGVGKPDPEDVGRLPVTELGVGEMDKQAIPDRRTEKWPLPGRPPAIRAPEKIPSGQGDPRAWQART